MATSVDKLLTFYNIIQSRLNQLTVYYKTFGESAMIYFEKYIETDRNLTNFLQILTTTERNLLTGHIFNTKKDISRANDSLKFMEWCRRQEVKDYLSYIKHEDLEYQHSYAFRQLYGEGFNIAQHIYALTPRQKNQLYVRYVRENRKIKKLINYIKMNIFHDVK